MRKHKVTVYLNRSAPSHLVTARYHASTAAAGNVDHLRPENEDLEPQPIHIGKVTANFAEDG